METCVLAINHLSIFVGVFRSFFCPLMFIFGFTANLVSFYIFFTHRPLTRYNLYPMALSISESLILLTNSLFDDFLGRGLEFLSKGQLRVKLDAGSNEACRLFEFIENWNAFVIAYILLAFGIDRVLSISFAHVFRAQRHIKTTCLIYIGIMSAGAILCGPIAAQYSLVEESKTTLISGKLSLVIEDN